MGQVVTYSNGASTCYCQIKLESGERIFISIGGGSVKVMTMMLGGLLPRSTLREWKAPQDTRALIALLGKDAAGSLTHPLDALRDKLLPCRSLTEVKQILHAAV